MPNSKAYLLRDNNAVYGKLFYQTDSKEFTINIDDNVDLKTAPLMISAFVSDTDRTIPPAWAKKWVNGRIIPSSRVNIASILVKNDMTEYDEMQMLLYTNGRCPQDDMWIEEVV
jgi:hypothetical protein